MKPFPRTVLNRQRTRTARIVSLACVITFLFTVAGARWQLLFSQRQLDEKWKLDLIERGLAGYNRKTGEWEYRSLDDVALDRLLENRAKAHADLPLPLPEEPKPTSSPPIVATLPDAPILPESGGFKLRRKKP